MRADPTKYKRAGKFLPVQIDYGADDDLDAQLRLAEDAGARSSLPPPTQALVKTLFDVKQMKRVLLEYQVDTQKMPLGKLSQAPHAAPLPPFSTTPRSDRSARASRTEGDLPARARPASPPSTPPPPAPSSPRRRS